jgi:methyl-accepting chemotaxis protein
MRILKPYRQWFLQIPILFCSGSLVYFGWPYLAILVHGCLSVWVFMRSLNIVTANELQGLALNECSADDVVIFCQQIKPLVLECENNLSAIMSTHDDALATLTNAFNEILDIHITLDTINLKSKANPEVPLELHDIAKRLEATLNNSIRGLQFGDINGQNLIYTKGMLAFVISQLQTINVQSSNGLSQFLKKQPEIIRNRQLTVTNPVSSSSMSSGEVTLFS